MTPIEHMHACVRFEDHVPAIDNFPQIENVPWTNQGRDSQEKKLLEKFLEKLLEMEF